MNIQIKVELPYSIILIDSAILFLNSSKVVEFSVSFDSRLGKVDLSNGSITKYGNAHQPLCSRGSQTKVLLIPLKSKKNLSFDFSMQSILPRGTLNNKLSGLFYKNFKNFRSISASFSIFSRT